MLSPSELGYTMRNNSLSRWGMLALGALVIAGPVAGGCRVDEQDIARWETTQRGPDKLVAVLRHDKYEPKLRAEAALGLIRMKPRKGQVVGIPAMVKTMADVDKDERKVILDHVVPTMVEEMGKPPPVAQGGVPLPPDPSVPFKDATYALLTYDKTNLVADGQQRAALMDALARWPAADFEHRFDNASQLYSVQQVIRFVGEPAARLLPDLIHEESRKIPDLAELLAATADRQTKERASAKIVEVAKHTASEAWLKRLEPAVREANAAAKLNPNPDQFRAQLEAAQAQQLERIFGSMKKVGGRAVVEYSLSVAADTKQPVDRRRLAVAALENNFDQQNPNDVAKILALAAADETPDQVRDLAFRRVGEMPRDKVIGKLFEIFENERWQVRWVAAQYAIRMSNTKHLDDIMRRLPDNKRSFSMTEALSYGDWLGDPDKMEEKDGVTAPAQLKRYLNDSNAARQTTALGYYYAHGTKRDVPFLAQYENNPAKVPTCDDKQVDCQWRCFVPKPDGKEDEKIPKDVESVGDFVKFCIVPAIKDKEPAKAGDRCSLTQTGAARCASETCIEVTCEGKEKKPTVCAGAACNAPGTPANCPPDHACFASTKGGAFCIPTKVCP